MTAPGWTCAADVRAYLQQQWDRGRLLASVVSNDGVFPLRVPFKRPTSSELASRFGEAQAWIAELRGIPRVRVEFQTSAHRQLGANEVPAAVWVDSIDDASVLIGKSRDLDRFRRLAVVTRARRPDLMPLLARRPLEVLDAEPAWGRLLDVADWMEAHPRPGVFVRQLDVVGVDTKFIERHQRLLAAVLDAVLPSSAIDASSRPGDFVRRYGFLERPRLIRFRALDDALRPALAASDGECAVTAADLARFRPPTRVFITENEINYLSLPPAPGAIAIFGSGAGLDHFGLVPWLREVPVHYWGDIDTHGMAILDQLRVVLPEARSLMMDRPTLMAHEDHWGVEDKPTRRELPRLHPDELDLYNDLRDNRVRPNLRLEQERIEFAWVARAVAAAVNVC